MKLHQVQISLTKKHGKNVGEVKEAINGGGFKLINKGSRPEDVWFTRKVERQVKSAGYTLSDGIYSKVEQ